MWDGQVYILGHCNTPHSSCSCLGAECVQQLSRACSPQSHSLLYSADVMAARPLILAHGLWDHLTDLTGCCPPDNKDAPKRVRLIYSCVPPHPQPGCKEAQLYKNSPCCCGDCPSKCSLYKTYQKKRAWKGQLSSVCLTATPAPCAEDQG